MKKKNWAELKADSSWRMFKIMSEFVDGFEKMERFGPCISIFGSARTKPDNKYYQMTVKTAELLAKEGFGIITGGGPGIMEAGNKGAKQGKGSSVGLHIELGFEQDWNEFIDAEKLLIFKYFFARKVMFIRYAQAFVFMPGGFGTIDEVFETLTLIQTKKMEKELGQLIIFNFIGRNQSLSIGFKLIIQIKFTVRIYHSFISHPITFYCFIFKSHIY